MSLFLKLYEYVEPCFSREYISELVNYETFIYLFICLKNVPKEGVTIQKADLLKKVIKLVVYLQFKTAKC